MSNSNENNMLSLQTPTANMIWTRYHPYMAGMDLPDNQVVRANKYKHYLFEEEDRFWEYSAVNRPTYGNCLSCWKSGPLSKTCNECPGKHCAYHQLFYVISSKENVYLDAESIAKTIGKGHEVARADRTVEEIEYDKFEINVELFLAKYDPEGIKKKYEICNTVLEYFGGNGYEHCTTIQSYWFRK